MAVLGSIFKSEENIFLSAETLEEYALASTEAAYVNTGEQALIGLMGLGGEIQVSENISPWIDREHSSFPYMTGTNNANWETADMHMSVAE